MFQGLTRFAVKLDRDRFGFGETIEGTLHVTNTKKLELAALDVDLVCDEFAAVRTVLKDTGSTQNAGVAYRTANIFRGSAELKEKAGMFKGNVGILPPGDHAFTFEVGVPHNSSSGGAGRMCPSSMSVSSYLAKNEIDFGRTQDTDSRVEWKIVASTSLPKKLFGRQKTAETSVGIVVLPDVPMADATPEYEEMQTAVRQERFEDQIITCTLHWPASLIEPSDLRKTRVTLEVSDHGGASRVVVGTFNLWLDGVVNTSFVHEVTGKRLSDEHHTHHPIMYKDFSSSTNSFNDEIAGAIGDIVLREKLPPSASSMFTHCSYNIGVQISLRSASQPQRRNTIISFSEPIWLYLSV